VPDVALAHVFTGDRIMLCELAIKNFAIIDDVRIVFSKGLTVLSGETGAGKSIVVNAMNLTLGGRASAHLIRFGCDSAEIEAFFEILPGCPAEKAMRQNEIDVAEGLLIRRIIALNNRHKIYINGRMATLPLLSAITENLVGISGQHAHQGLLKEDLQLTLLDQFGGLLSLRDAVAQSYRRLDPLIRELDDLFRMKDRRAEQLDLLQFQKKEIEEAGLRIGEDEELALERSRLKNGELLYGTASDCIDSLYDDRGSAFERLSSIGKSLDKLSGIDPTLKKAAAGLEEILYRAEDLAKELRAYLKNIRIDPAGLEEIEKRLDFLAKLKRKYGGSLEIILKRLAAIEQDLSSIENISEKISAVEFEIKQNADQLAGLAVQLSIERHKAAKLLGAGVEKELADLKMSDTKFCTVLRNQPAGRETSPYLAVDGNTILEAGVDLATYMIAPNVGEELKPLADIASGGELSRIVLALKSILARTQSVETVVFDEVDAGIGGGTAEVIGKKMAQLSAHHQVICITHLPQIAKFADHHFKITKIVDKGRTKTAIERISEKQRVEEIARMLGGETITEKTLDHAREMLEKKG
jgi:DNA repair protein RecN (Recombination protein N)